MPKILLTVVALLFFSASFAQDYVVTIKSDTIKGDVKLLSYDLLDRVQLAQGKQKTMYTALQVRRVNYKGEQFAPVKFENGIRLMKILQSGYLSLYAFRAVGQAGYDTRVLQKVGTTSMEVPNMGFKKFVGDLVADCPVVGDKVKNGDVGRSQIDAIVAEYNKCISGLSEQRMDAAQSATPIHTPADDLIEQLKTKVTASDLSNKNEVNDLLNSMAERLRKKEKVPPYMKEGLKGYLSSREDLKTDMEQLLTLLDN